MALPFNRVRVLAGRDGAKRAYICFGTMKTRDANMKCSRCILLVVGLLVAVGSGCRSTSASGYALARDIVLSVESPRECVLMIRWHGQEREIQPDDKGGFRFKTPVLRTHWRVWFGTFTRRQTDHVDEPFLYVYIDGNEEIVLSVADVWNLPKSQSGTMVLRLKP